MNRYVFMLALCVAVVASMSGILYRFFRRLKRIEQQRWGQVRDKESLRSSWDRYRVRRADRRSRRTAAAPAPADDETPAP